MLYLLLIAAGWVSVVGSSYNYGDPLILDFAQRSGKQLIWMICSLGLGFALLLTDEKLYDTFSYVFYILMMGLLLVTPFIAHDSHGSYSWINLTSTIQIQPAEFAKCATALALAKCMGTYGFSIYKTRDFLRAMGIVLLPIVLIILQRETGSALVYLAFFLVFYREGMSGTYLFVGIAAIVYFIVGIRYDELMLPQTETSVGAFSVLLLIWFFTGCMTILHSESRTGGLYILSIGGAVMLGAYLVSRFIIPFDITVIQLIVCLASIGFLLVRSVKEHTYKYLFTMAFALGSLAFYYSANIVLDHLPDHQPRRILVLLGMKDDILGAGYNVHQSQIAIGSGGIWGKGFLNGTQTKLNYVPEQDTDFIFCTVGEEWGFVGAAVVLLLFLVLILRLIHIAERQPTTFARVYGYSVLSILLFHVMVNIGMVIGLMPVIGIPLPLFSYGGSSLWGFTLLLFIFLRLDASRGLKRR